MNKSNDAYKSISEVAQMLNLINPKTGKVSTHTLRFWEQEFEQVKPKIFAGKRRYYDNESIEVLKKIKFLLKDRGLTVKGVKKYFLKGETSLDETANTTINKKNILKSKLSKISKIAKELKK